jgi:hypothetical protein
LRRGDGGLRAAVSILTRRSTHSMSSCGRNSR